LGRVLCRQYDRPSAPHILCPEPGEAAQTQAAPRSARLDPGCDATKIPGDRNGHKSHDQPETRQALERCGIEVRVKSPSQGERLPSTNGTQQPARTKGPRSGNLADP